MSKLIDLTGQIFGRLTVIGQSPVKVKNGVLWECQCSCGTIKNIRSNSLRRKKDPTRSCGCINEENCRNKAEKLEGKVFGKLTVLSRHGSTNHGRSTWKCQCSCNGPKSVVIVSSGDLKHSNSPTRSCGCLRIEHSKRTHPKEEHRFYRIWYDMIYRCTNENNSCYYRYGGRGIKIQSSWNQYKNFKIDTHKSYVEHVQTYGEKDTTIDRKNNDGDYSINNVRWATRMEQNMNKSIGSSEYFKAKYTISGPSYGYEEISNNHREFSRKYNLNRVCVGNCIRSQQISHKGWTFEKV